MRAWQNLLNMAACLLFLGFGERLWASEYVNVATYTNSTTLTVGRVCAVYSATDLSCSSVNPYVSTAGLVGLGGITPTVALEVSGTVSATAFVGNGSGLTGIALGDRITSSTTRVVVDGVGGFVSFTQLGVDTAYLHPSLGLVAAGVSTTGGISGTTGYFVGSVVIGTGANAASLVIKDSAQSYNGFLRYGAVGTGLIFPTTEPNSLAFRANYSEVMRVVSNGFVGIGRTAPSATLDVSGAIKISGDNTETCAGASDYGKMRWNATLGGFQICKP